MEKILSRVKGGTVSKDRPVGSGKSLAKFQEIYRNAIEPKMLAGTRQICYLIADWFNCFNFMCEKNAAEATQFV